MYCILEILNYTKKKKKKKKLGIKLTIIHRVLQFNESKWLEPYIDFNTKKRSNAKNDFEKDFFSCLITLSSVKLWQFWRKRINVKLACNEIFLKKKHGAKANKISSKMFNENLFAFNRIGFK